MYGRLMTTETCAATHTSPAAGGDLEVRCARPVGHDGQHEGKVGVFPVRWRDQQPN